MENFELLGGLAIKLHYQFRNFFYLMLPVFFALSLVFAWFKNPQGGADIITPIKRALIATLLLVSFQEISDSILWITGGIADKISDMSSLNEVMQMASKKIESYEMSASSILLAFNDLMIAVLSFLSFVILYVARYLTIALYHFMWLFLSIMAPILILFHLFSPQITLNLFKSLIEVASWRIVWSVLSAMLGALPFGNAYAAEGNYLTVITLNFVIAMAMLATPHIVKSLVGSGLSSMSSALGPAAAAAMIAAPTRVTALAQAGKMGVGSISKFVSGQKGIFSGSGSQGFHTSSNHTPTSSGFNSKTISPNSNGEENA